MALKFEKLSFPLFLPLLSSFFSLLSNTSVYFRALFLREDEIFPTSESDCTGLRGVRRNLRRLGSIVLCSKETKSREIVIRRNQGTEIVLGKHTRYFLFLPLFPPPPLPPLSARKIERSVKNSDLFNLHASLSQYT